MDTATAGPSVLDAASACVTVSLDRKRFGDKVWRRLLNLVRGVFDKKVRRKPLAFASDAVIIATGNYG